MEASSVKSTCCFDVDSYSGFDVDVDVDVDGATAEAEAQATTRPDSMMKSCLTLQLLQVLTRLLRPRKSLKDRNSDWKWQIVDWI